MESVFLAALIRLRQVERRVLHIPLRKQVYCLQTFSEGETCEG